jgi:hypothetical protein
MVQKDGTIVLNNFQQAQAESPFIGYAKMQCVDLETPGVAKIQPRTTLRHSTNGLPMAIVRDVSGNVYVGTDTGYLYKNGTVLNSGLVRVYDLLVFENYLLIFRDTVIDAYGPLDNIGVSYFGNWKTGLTTGYYHKAIADPDNDVFFGNAGSVGKITSFTAAAPGVAPTATLVAAEKDLPSGEFVRTLAMKGIFLAIGTQAGGGYLDVAYGVGNVYFWDRASTLFEDNFLQFNESGIHQILNVGDSLVIHAGIYGNVYESNGISVGTPKKINFNNESNATTLLYPNAIGQIGKEIIVGTSTGTDAFPSKSTHGVWTLSKGAASLRNIISTDGLGATQNLIIGAILSLNSGINRSIFIGWRDGSSYGVDEIDIRLYDEYQTVIESEVHHVGEYLNKKPYNQLEITLAKPLISSQTIRVSQRANLTDDYTVLGTYTTSNTDSGQVAILDSAISIIDSVLVQMKVELKQATSSLYTENIFLMEVRLKQI